jgi:hypothetical protein
MGDNGNRKTEYWLTTEFPVGDLLEERIAQIRRERRTGMLTINFSLGSPSGGFAWKEHLHGPYDPAELHLIYGGKNAG